MLRISRMADYATNVMVYLARHENEVHNAKAIAEGIHVQLPTVSKLLKMLTSADLLQSQRGSQGGYQFARAVENISIADIIEAIDGKSGLTQCSYSEGECFLEDVCAIRGNWRLISDAIYSALDKVSLKQFAEPTLKTQAIHVKPIRQLHTEVVLDADDDDDSKLHTATKRVKCNE